MKLVYASRTGNIEKLVGRLGISDAVKITSGDEVIGEPFILITYTDGNGILPAAVDKFVSANKADIKAAAVSGNKERHPDTFCFAANVLREKYGVNIITTFDKDGSEETEKAVKEALGQ